MTAVAQGAPRFAGSTTQRTRLDALDANQNVPGVGGRLTGKPYASRVFVRKRTNMPNGTYLRGIVALTRLFCLD